MRKVIGLMLLTIIGLGLAVSEPKWPEWFSRQDKVNPALMRPDYQEDAKVGVYDNLLVEVPKMEDEKVLGEEAPGKNQNKKIEVDLTNQKLLAIEDGRVVYDYKISSGKWGRTPTGDYKIWIKIRSQKMSGGSKELGTYYYLPNVPYIMFFYNNDHPKQQGFSIHGTYWHNNFGYPMSHGCINMKTEEAKMIYEWAEVGIPIKIYGKFEYK